MQKILREEGKGETHGETEAQRGWGTARDEEGSKMSPKMWAMTRIMRSLQGFQLGATRSILHCEKMVC